MPMTKLLAKWNRWLGRIEQELLELIVQQQHFHELEAATSPYIGRETGWELARWIAQGYAAYTCM
jgi:hypothetical protein